MPSLSKTLKLLGLLLVIGLVKLPFEKAYSDQLQARGVTPPSLSVEKWNRMGQTSLAGVLGGLRSVIAVAFSMKAHSHFSDQEWYELHNDYEVITALDPNNPFYWNNGGWHLAYNAAGWAQLDPELDPRMRDTLEMEYLLKGEQFFTEGLKYLPNNIDLWAQIGTMWTSPFKRPDFPRAAKAWKEAYERGDNPIYQRRYFYTLAQIRGREYDALAIGQELVKENPNHARYPSFRVIYWMLSQLPGATEPVTLEQMFGDKERAYRELYNYRFRVHEESFYGEGLDDTLWQLIRELKVPTELNPFLNPRRRRITHKEWKKEMSQKD